MPQLLPPAIFLGPTLDHCQAAGLVEADFHPPAAMGDVTRVVTAGSSAVILIDGVFESGPSVWHKEILLAMRAGVPVIGASSMGALRAAELCSYGMLGSGRIFEDFASRRLTDDDEVAVVHGPAETGWMPLSDALVDIRATVALAAEERILSPAMAHGVIDHAKATYFKSRSLSDSVDSVLPQYMPDNEKTRIRNWFAAHAVSQKRNDCVELLRHLPEAISAAAERVPMAAMAQSTAYLRHFNDRAAPRLSGRPS